MDFRKAYATVINYLISSQLNCPFIATREFNNDGKVEYYKFVITKVSEEEAKEVINANDLCYNGSEKPYSVEY